MCEWLRAVWVGCSVSQKNVATNRGRFYGYPPFTESIQNTDLIPVGLGKFLSNHVAVKKQIEM